MKARDIEDEISLKRWLKARPEWDARVLATRAALRAVPFLAGTATRMEDAAWAPLILGGFAANAFAWLVVTRQDGPIRFRSARVAFPYDTARLASGATRGDPTRADAAAAALAAAWTARTGSTSAAVGAAALAAKTAAADAEIAFSNLSASSADLAAADAENVFWREVCEDAKALEFGVPAQILAKRQLWQGENAVWVDWDWLKSALLARPDEHWDVWTDWYEARLRGEPGNDEEEIARVLQVTEEEWAAGPAVANAKIKAILARFRNPPEVEPSPEPPPRLPIGPKLRAAAGQIDLVPPESPPIPLAQRRAAVAEAASDLLGHCDPASNDSKHFLEPLNRLISALADAEVQPSSLALRANLIEELADKDRERRIKLAADPYANVDGVLNDVARATLDTLLNGLRGLYANDPELAAERESWADPAKATANQAAVAGNRAVLETLLKAPEALTDAAEQAVSEIVEASEPGLLGQAPSPAAAAEAASAVQTSAVEAAKLALEARKVELEAERLGIERAKLDQNAIALGQEAAKLELKKDELDPGKQATLEAAKAAGKGIGELARPALIASGALGGGAVGWLVMNAQLILAALAANPNAAAAYQFVLAVLRKLGVAV